MKSSLKNEDNLLFKFSNQNAESNNLHLLTFASGIVHEKGCFLIMVEQKI